MLEDIALDIRRIDLAAPAAFHRWRRFARVSIVRGLVRAFKFRPKIAEQVRPRKVRRRREISLPRIALSNTFMRVHGRLDSSVRKKVDALCGKLRDGAHLSGVHLEPYKNAADPRARTARVDRNWRAILADTGAGELILLTVLKHDDADRWMMSNKFDVNSLTGAFSLIDVEAVKALAPAMPTAASDAAPGPLAHRSEKDLRQVGISDADVCRVLLRAETEAEVHAIASLLPADQCAAVELLVQPDDTVDEIYAALQSELDIPEDEVDTTDLGAALNRPATARDYILVDGNNELEEVLGRDFAAWEVFLHPAQRAAAYRERFNGPVRISGGPGTGKTVALIHRAAFLARRLRPDDPPILLTTYTRRLASDLRRLLVQLAGTDIIDRVEVKNIDKVAFSEYRRINQSFRALGEDEDDEWQRVAGSAAPLMAAFLRDEFEHVVLAQNLQSGGEYLRATRRGRGRTLNRADRARVWSAINEFQANTIGRDRPNFQQMAHEVAKHRADDETGTYSHILVDEAQDISPAQWRMLRSLVKRAPNDMFIAGDSHQRIYDRYVTLKSVGIDIVGRSSKLHVNYRTTSEILGWSLGVLSGCEFDDLDGGADTLLGYRSETFGDDPIIRGFATDDDENEAVAEQVATWIAEGVNPAEIGICARTRQRTRSVFGALRHRELSVGQMDADHDGVRIGTMHLAKGLEFRFVVLVGVNQGVVPWATSDESQSADPVSEARWMTRERSLLYVAASRAREGLTITWAGSPSELLPARRELIA